jgi:nitric oxide synthase-interacting protein
MAKHSKNNCGNSVFTYVERKMLKYKNLWGDIVDRMGQDSQKMFEQCSICLSFAINPVCCPKGSIFCKQCLLENFIHQKQETKKLIKKYEEQEKAKELMEQNKKDKNKEDDDNMIKATKIYHENDHHDLKRCFWNWEHLDPFVKEIKERPKNVLYCPSCEKKHIFGSKEYINLHMKIINEEPNCKYICSVCEKVLGIQKIVALKKCGHVFCAKCLEDICKEDICPACSIKFNNRDKISLKCSGTGYSTHNKVTSKMYIPAYRY